MGPDEVSSTGAFRHFFSPDFGGSLGLPAALGRVRCSLRASGADWSLPCALVALTAAWQGVRRRWYVRCLRSFHRFVGGGVCPFGANLGPTALVFQSEAGLRLLRVVDISRGFYSIDPVSVFQALPLLRAFRGAIFGALSARQCLPGAGTTRLRTYATRSR